MFYTGRFWFKTFEKVLPLAPDESGEKTINDAVVAFFQCEAADVDNRSKVETKFVKNIKWLAGKFGSQNIVLHYFSHLSMSKSPPEFSAEFTGAAAGRLSQSGYEVTVTPFGYLNEWEMHVLGDSLAKVFKEF